METGIIESLYLEVPSVREWQTAYPCRCDAELLFLSGFESPAAYILNPSCEVIGCTISGGIGKGIKKIGEGSSCQNSNQ